MPESANTPADDEIPPTDLELALREMIEPYLPEGREFEDLTEAEKGEIEARMEHDALQLQALRDMTPAERARAAVNEAFDAAYHYAEKADTTPPAEAEKRDIATKLATAIANGSDATPFHATLAIGRDTVTYEMRPTRFDGEPYIAEIMRQGADRETALAYLQEIAVEFGADIDDNGLIKGSLLLRNGKSVEDTTGALPEREAQRRTGAEAPAPSLGALPADDVPATASEAEIDAFLTELPRLAGALKAQARKDPRLAKVAEVVDFLKDGLARGFSGPAL